MSETKHFQPFQKSLKTLQGSCLPTSSHFELLSKNRQTLALRHSISFRLQTTHSTHTLLFIYSQGCTTLQLTTNITTTLQNSLRQSKLFPYHIYYTHTTSQYANTNTEAARTLQSSTKQLTTHHSMPKRQPTNS